MAPAPDPLGTPGVQGATTPALAGLAARVEAHCRQIAATRMAGLPIVHPGLQVRLLGLAPWDEQPGLAWGVLVTPWSMGLLALPIAAGGPPPDSLPRPGRTEPRQAGDHRLDFIGADDPALGPHAICPLFSPMGEFADQAAALATARAVLQALRPPAPAPGVPSAMRGAVPEPTPACRAPACSMAAGPARRRFLFGRGAAR